MRAPHWIMWSWPGLDSLWLFGQFTGIVKAAVFAALLNLNLVSTFVWPAWIDPDVRNGLWLVLLGYWVLSFWSACRKHQNMTGSEEAGALFVKAQDEYLRGDWYGTERILQKLLRGEPHDIEARLLLATLFRHTKRFEEARLELRRIQKMVVAGHWQAELVREWHAIERIASGRSSDPAPPATRAA